MVLVSKIFHDRGRAALQRWRVVLVSFYFLGVLFNPIVVHLPLLRTYRLLSSVRCRASTKVDSFSATTTRNVPRNLVREVVSTDRKLYIRELLRDHHA